MNSFFILRLQCIGHCVVTCIIFDLALLLVGLYTAGAIYLQIQAARKGPFFER